MSVGKASWPAGFAGFRVKSKSSSPSVAAAAAAPTCPPLLGLTGLDNGVSIPESHSGFRGRDPAVGVVRFAATAPLPVPPLDSDWRSPPLATGWDTGTSVPESQSGRRLGAAIFLFAPPPREAGDDLEGDTTSSSRSVAGLNGLSSSMPEFHSGRGASRSGTPAGFRRLVASAPPREELEAVEPPAIVLGASSRRGGAGVEGSTSKFHSGNSRCGAGRRRVPRAAALEAPKRSRSSSASPPPGEDDAVTGLLAAAPPLLPPPPFRDGAASTSTSEKLRHSGLRCWDCCGCPRRLAAGFGGEASSRRRLKKALSVSHLTQVQPSGWANAAAGGGCGGGRCTSGVLGLLPPPLLPGRGGHAEACAGPGEARAAKPAEARVDLALPAGDADVAR